MKKAIITGITGQVGSYMAEFLLAKGYEVHGIIRRASTFNTDRTTIFIKTRTKRVKESRFITAIWQTTRDFAGFWKMFSPTKFTI